MLTLTEFFKLTHILPGYYFNLSAQQYNKKRQKNIEFKLRERAKKKKKKKKKALRPLKKGYFDKEQEIWGGQL